MTLYTGTADYYLKYRYGYAPVFYQKLFSECGIDNKSQVMDLACGPGIVALDVAPLVRNVIAVDIEDEFIDCGKIEAEKRSIKNIDWHKLNADDITTLGKMVNMIIISHAFHWLNREKVAELAYRMLLPGGSIVIASDNTAPRWNTPEVKVLVEKLLGDKGNFILKTNRQNSIKKHAEVLEEAGFKLKEFILDCGQRITTPERVMGWYMSTSFANPEILGDNLDIFKKEVGAMLSALPPEAFVEDVKAKALIGFK